MTAFLESTKQLGDGYLVKFITLFTGMINFLAQHTVSLGLYTLIVRWVFPVLAVIIFWRCIRPFPQGMEGKGLWGYLCTADGLRIPLQRWENLIGRSRFSDIFINLPYISRSHAVLTFYDGTWSITDLRSKGGVKVNERRIEKPEKVGYGDTIDLAGAKLVLLPVDQEVAVLSSDNNNCLKTPGNNGAGVTLFLVTIFQILGSLQLCFSMSNKISPAVPLIFFLFILTLCLHYLIIVRWRNRKYFEPELICYFLCGLNLLIVASATPSSLLKQFVAFSLGLAAYTVIGILLRDLSSAHQLRNFLLVSAFLLLIMNLTRGETHYGAKNWINLGSVTFQPMEFVKIAFVMVGTATLPKLLTTRNMTVFLIFSGACILTLSLIKDFGTALVFLGAFVSISFMHSGDLRTIALTMAGAFFGAIAALSFMPHIASRFAAWGKVWELAHTSGYQQVRTMIAAASGGLLGLGGGNGYLADISTADTDLVFGILCEEWGLVVALVAILMIAFLALYAVMLIKNCRSSFYAIIACGAATIFLIQTALNVLGSVDILPLTGITIPFLSRGGSSMITSWGLLALLKSAEEHIRGIH